MKEKKIWWRKIIVESTHFNHSKSERKTKIYRIIISITFLIQIFLYPYFLSLSLPSFLLRCLFLLSFSSLLHSNYKHLKNPIWITSQMFSSKILLFKWLSKCEFWLNHNSHKYDHSWLESFGTISYASLTKKSWYTFFHLYTSVFFFFFLHWKKWVIGVKVGMSR